MRIMRLINPLLRCTVILSICLSLLLGGTAYADNNGGTEKKAQLKQLDTEMKQLKKLLRGFKSQRSELQNKLRKSEIAIGSLQKQIRKTQRQLKKEQSELHTLQTRRQSLQTDKRKQQKIIEQQILSAFQIGQQKKLKVLLNQENPEKLSRALTYYDYFNRARAEQIEDYANIISEIDTIEPAIEQKATTLKQAKRQLEGEHQQLIHSKSARQSNLAKINARIKDKDQHLKKLSKDRLELERLVEAVEQTIANISIPSDYRPFSQLKGKLPWPIKGKPSNNFGSRRSGSTLRWQGITIPAREGSNIKAIHHGRVVFADWLRGSGLLIIIDHGDGYMSLYAHNQSLFSETGDWVGAGEVISTTGNSGGQQQSGLYFEIRHNGTPTNPRRWFKRG